MESTNKLAKAADFIRLKCRSRSALVIAACAVVLIVSLFYFSSYSSRSMVTVETALQDDSSTQSYILSLGYNEQLSNALRNFLELGSLARDFKARLVIPFVYSSRLYGMPTFIPSASSDQSGFTGAYPLTDVFNILDFTRTCYDSSVVPDSFLQFLSHSTRDIVVLYPVMGRSFLGGKNVATKLHPELTNPAIKKNLFSCMKGGRAKTRQYCFCGHLLEPFVLQLQSALTQHSPDRPFRIRAVLCLLPGKEITTQDLLYQVQNETRIERLSFVMAHWNGLACHAFCNCSEGSQRAYISPETNVLSSCDDGLWLGSGDRYNLMSQFIPPEIHQLTREFLASQGIVEGVKMLGAHIRMERMGRDFTEIQCCVDSFIEVVNRVRKRMGSASTKVVFISDSREYGTQTCEGEKCSNVTNFIRHQLSLHDLNPVQFNPVHFGARNRESLVALVEMLALSHSTELVYMGFNSAFQRSILGNAIHRGITQRVHITCGGVSANANSSSLPEDFVHTYDTCKADSIN